MKVAVILGSQRKNGTSKIIEENIMNLSLSSDFDFIRMSELKVEGCIACEKCSTTGRCVLPQNTNDMFNNILNRLITANVIILITPIYSPYPSRLTALMERLLSISFFAFQNSKITRPLKGKSTAIICYGSSKIENENQLKLLFQKLLMDKYSFTDINYQYINQIENPNEKYKNVVEYVNDIVCNCIK